MNSIEKSNTSIFFVPVLGIGKKVLVENGFINGYLNETVTSSKYDDSIYLLFRPEYPIRFHKFLEREKLRTKYLIDQYDLKSGFCILVYRLNDDFKSDFELIKASRYSRTSKKFQSLFPSHVDIEKNGKLITERSLQNRVFNKSTDLEKYLRDNNKQNTKYSDECWSAFNEDNETLTNKLLSELMSYSKI